MTAAAAILDFRICEILLADKVQSVEAHQSFKFSQNWSICCKYIKIFRFFKMAAAAILDLFGAYLDHPEKVLRVSITLLNLVTIDDRCGSFYNINVLIFGALGLKTPIHVPEIGFFGQFHPLNGL